MRVFGILAISHLFGGTHQSHIGRLVTLELVRVMRRAEIWLGLRGLKLSLVTENGSLISNTALDVDEENDHAFVSDQPVASASKMIAWIEAAEQDALVQQSFYACEMWFVPVFAAKSEPPGR